MSTLDEMRGRIILVADAFLAKRKITDQTVGMYAVRDGRSLIRVRGGGTFGVAIYDKFMRYFSDNWPDGATWPDLVPRPDHADKEHHNG